MAISDPIRAWLRRLGRLLPIPMAVLLLASPGRPAPASGSFTVNSSADANTYDAELTLREALLVANGALTGGLSDGERDQLGGCTFSGSPGNWTITGAVERAWRTPSVSRAI